MNRKRERIVGQADLEKLRQPTKKRNHHHRPQHEGRVQRETLSITVGCCWTDRCPMQMFMRSFDDVGEFLQVFRSTDFHFGYEEMCSRAVMTYIIGVQ